MYYRPQFAAYGRALGSTSITYMSQAAIEAAVGERLGLKSRYVRLGDPQDFQGGYGFECLLANIAIDPETYTVTVDGRFCTAKPKCCPWRSVISFWPQPCKRIFEH